MCVGVVPSEFPVRMDYVTLSLTNYSIPFILVERAIVLVTESVVLLSDHGVVAGVAVGKS